MTAIHAAAWSTLSKGIQHSRRTVLKLECSAAQLPCQGLEGKLPPIRKPSGMLIHPTAINTKFPCQHTGIVPVQQASPVGQVLVAAPDAASLRPQLNSCCMWRQQHSPCQCCSMHACTPAQQSSPAIDSHEHARRQPADAGASFLYVHNTQQGIQWRYALCTRYENQL